MFSYDGLEALLKEKGIGKTELSLALGLSTRTVAKIAKGEKLSKNTINKIADYLGVSPELLYRIEADNKILRILRAEKEIHLPIIRGGKCARNNKILRNNNKNVF